MECLDNLVGIKELCTESGTTPLFWLDDAEGIDRIALSQISKPSVPSGLAFGNEIIESATRFLIADIETLIPKGHTIKSSLNNFCNVCTYTALQSNTPFTGVVIKNISTSEYSLLSVDSLKVRIGSTGDYTIVLDDGVDPRIISHSFVSGVEVVIKNINYKSESREIKIYFLETVNVTALSCPTTRSCGCSGGRKQSTDITVTGLLNNAEFTTQYGFIPCASVVCSMDDILCNIVNQQPRLFGLALFYRSAARYFSEFPVTQRVNRNASFKEDEKIKMSEYYMELYEEVLRGSEKRKGIADNMSAAMNSINDVCVECQRLTAVSWAIG